LYKKRPSGRFFYFRYQPNLLKKQIGFFYLTGTFSKMNPMKIVCFCTIFFMKKSKQVFL